MAVGIPLDRKIGNNVAMLTWKHLVINLTRCFFYPHTKLINSSNINKNENFEYSLNNNKNMSKTISKKWFLVKIRYRKVYAKAVIVKK